MNNKLELLKQIIKNHGSMAVAYSGGVDSTFLAKVAYDVLGEKAVAITVKAGMVPEREIKDSIELAEQIGINQYFLELDAGEVEVFKTNPKDRCYHCKKHIFMNIKEKAREFGIECVADGSNLDDMGDYRPGMKAIKELNVASPLKEAGLTKDEIREYSKELGLGTWDKPAFACLATRFPYDVEITKEKLKTIEQAEDYLLELGFRQFRVRCHGDVARIEVVPEDRVKFFDVVFMDKVSKRFKEFGFVFVALDLEGYKMGNMNVGVEQ